MEKTVKNLLIVGEPGIGKTTVIQKLAQELKSSKPVGFFTAEIRVDGSRKGFQAVSLDGRKRNLAHTDTRSRVMVGKYRVNVYGFEKFLRSLDLEADSSRIVLLDEVGRMECQSARFRKMVEVLLEQDRPVVATVAANGTGLIEEIKERDDVALFRMQKRNRSEMVGKILRRLKAIRFG